MTRQKRTRNGETVARVLKALQDLGPMTRVEIERELGAERRTVSPVISRMNKPTKTGPKRLFISGYVLDDSDGVTRRYPRAVFDIGDKPDAKKPEPDIAENKRRYMQKQKSHVLMNSVFNLGKTRRQARAEGFYL